MIQYSNYKRFYAETGLFTLSGFSYEGYVEVLSGAPYVSNISDTYYNRCVVTSNTIKQPLERSTTFRTDLLCSDLFYDRYITDPVLLPYSLDDIKFSANDFLQYDILRSKLAKLHSNNTYTFSRCSLPNNKLPYSLQNVKYACALSITDNFLSILSGYQDIPTFSGNLSFIDLGNIKGFTVVNNIDDDSKSVIFAYTDTKLIALACSESSVSVIDASPYYNLNTEENILTFSKIGGIVRVGTNLFVTDSGNDTIIKYDISGYINNDTVLANRRNLIEILGGRGKARDNLLFNTPTLLTSNGDNIVVYDSNNLVLKVYDTDFNFIAKIGNINLRVEQLATIEYNRLTNRLYVVTNHSNNIKLYVLDELYDIAEIYNLNILLRSGEIINNIEFSLNDSNYFYFCTSYNMYKLLVNRPNITMGRFTSNRFYSNARVPLSSDIVSTNVVSNNANDFWNYINIPFSEANYIWNANSGVTYSETVSSAGNIDTYNSTIYNDNFKGIRLTPQLTNADKLFFITSGKIYYFKEVNKLNTVLKADNFENFGNTITLNKNEYIQGSTLNKEFYKIVRDTLELKNNIVGRFTGGYDNRNVFRYSDYNYNIDLSEIFSETSNDYYIHDNEKNILGVFNRVIEQIYNIQEQLITLTNVDRGDEIAPVFNFGSTEPSNVLIIE